MPIANVNGVDIFYELTGTGGPVLMFANSLGTSLGMWRSQTAAFRQYYRILRYDMRGHGQSASPPGPYTIEMLSRDALALLDFLGLEKINFCGLSMGGLVGQWLGINAPRRLNRLILCATAPSFSGDVWANRIAAVREHGFPGIVDTVMERWFTDDFRKASPADVSAVRNMTLSASPDGYIACCEALAAVNFELMLERITTETLCLAGSDDQATPPEVVKRIADRIKGARFNVVEHGAHLFNIEQPGPFNALVRGFLEE